MRIITCNSPYGRGGLGQHFAQMVEESRAQGDLAGYYTPAPKPGDEKGTRLQRKSWQDALVQYSPARFVPSWRSLLYNEFFDRHVAEVLSAPHSHFMGFAGESLHSFRQARDMGVDTLELISPTSHAANLRRQHDEALDRHPAGNSWLNGFQMRKLRREYEMADTIYVHSAYTRRSFLDAGIPPEKLERTYLHIHPRFHPPEQRSDDDTFRIMYVGRVDVTKGIPLLLEAFDQLPVNDKELTLVGGWSSRSMRKYMEGWLDRDLTIRMAPGDPLPVLHQADVFVHPTYEDGFGYAPMEALACGVPVIVTEDTGMKEYVREGENGYVVPTGNRQAIIDRLMQLRRTPLTATASHLPPAYAEERRALPALADVAFNA
jgi:glycosyltransferase involved in cell wall biosynthesis